jgi:hypothetical protein
MTENAPCSAIYSPVPVNNPPCSGSKTSLFRGMNCGGGLGENPCKERMAAPFRHDHAATRRSRPSRNDARGSIMP